MLDVYKKLFHDLNKSEIRYCHFKSNDHLAAGLDGLTDLDIVLHPDDATKFLIILLSHDFKRTEAGFGVKNHFREGYLGFDVASAKLVYIDLHYFIVIGRSRIREYVLKEFSFDLLNNRTLDKKSNVFISSPEFEFFLLMLRASLKIRFRDVIKTWSGISFFDYSWTEQHNWLRSRSSLPDLENIVAKYFDAKSTRLVMKMFSQYPTNKLLFLNKSLINKHFYSSRKYGEVTTIGGMLLKELNGALSYLNRTLLSHALPVNRRYLSKGGKVVAFVGVDGSGKSTQLRTVSDVFAWKLDLATVYLGAGDGKASWHRSILIKAKSWLIRNNYQNTHVYQSEKKRKKNIFGVFARIVWAISLLLEKNVKLKKYHRVSKRGVLVLTDRYPQINVRNFNDGPLLNDYLNLSKNTWLKKLAEYEHNIYSGQKYGSPDLLIKLLVDPNVSIERGEEASVDYLKRRMKAVDAIDFKNSCKVVTIDASGPVEQVTRDISREIWKVL